MSHEDLYRRINRVKTAILHTRFGAVLRSPVGKLLRSWLFQGMFYMAPDELLFRLIVQTTTTAAIGWWLGVSGVMDGIVLVIVVHTLFWLGNSHFWALEIREGQRLVKNQPQAIRQYLVGLRSRCGKCTSMEQCFASGSLARGAFGPYSDLDVACVPRPGKWHRVAVLAFGMRERFIAAMQKMPVELYCYSTEALARISPDERRLVLKAAATEVGARSNWIAWDTFWETPSPFFREHEV